MLAVVVLPIIWAVSLAFQRVKLLNIRRTSVVGNYTLDNFSRVLQSEGFWETLWTTVVYTVGSTAGSLGLGLIAAMALRRPFRGRGAVRAVMLLPYITPVVAATFVWTVALDPQYGFVNAWGTSFLGWNEPIPFLSTERSELFGIPVPTALLTVIAFETWRYFPFAFLFLVARIQAIPGDLDEAARVDGASIWQRFRNVVWPQLLPVIALLTVLRFIFTFNKFDDVYLLTGGGAGTEVISVRVYEFLTARKDVGLAAAQAVVLAVVLIGLIIFYLRASSREQK
ncbi:MAG: Inner membrane ABC transporter permease protein YcjO [uncultured Corynebacteriales bacterium]|uniref:Inner membrane ABC transporter permease protein YcjO n=1 Tax=uncultured Mycobacteriales bacterium TaxID=581187 RepID=A0A6J4IIW3_9ACTN|nr:MAG: Inner membrane ABC transporter permease protein YcjO [uncultured Corynebacteriales bacterium]